MPETGLDSPTAPGKALRCAGPACGVEFIPRRPGHKYHSARCRKRHWERACGRGAASGWHLACPHCGAALLALNSSARDVSTFVGREPDKTRRRTL